MIQNLRKYNKKKKKKIENRVTKNFETMASILIFIQNNAENYVLKLPITDAKVYVSAVTTSTQYIVKLLMQLESGFKIMKNRRMYGQSVREMPETPDEKETWNCLRKTDLKVETETLLCAVQ